MTNYFLNPNKVLGTNGNKSEDQTDRRPNQTTPGIPGASAGEIATHRQGSPSSALDLTPTARLAGDDSAERAASSPFTEAESLTASPISSGAFPCGTEAPGGATRELPRGRTAVITSEIEGTDAEWREAQARASACEDFLRKTKVEHFSTIGAAKALGRSASQFSGPDSMLARYLRGGVAALVSTRSAGPGTAKAGDLTNQIEALAWFIPAAKFFYANTNLADGRGSSPEAIRRTISLPHLPVGWKTAMREKFCAALNLTEPPACPPELREAILARQSAGQVLVPERVLKQIIVDKSTTHFQRGPRRWALDNLSAPGSQRRYMSVNGRRIIMAPGDWFGGDDATPGVAVCVPCNEVITPCSQKFKVLLGRFQWLAYNDCRTDKILAWDYVVRPRGGYRFEDILNGMGTVTRTHGIPNQGWQFEGGTFNAKLVQEAIRLMGCEHWRTYSPHQKAIESVFNRVWTRLAVQFPHADMGRFRAENESNCALYEACKKGQQDPRRYFPTLDLVVQVFEEEVAAHNRRHIDSEQYGRWIPDEFFSQEVAAKPLRAFSPEMQWIFSPFAVERKVRAMMVRCRVPMFEDFSVPFEFNADWLPLYNGKSVRLHFDPRQPHCTAKLVLLENCGAKQAGDILGDAQLIGETAGHIRLIMGWAQDNQRAGYIARQRTANFMRRVSRGVGNAGRAEYTKDEQRDGIGTIQKLEKSTVQSPESRARAIEPIVEFSPVDRAARLREIEDLERQNAHLFT